MIIFTIGFTKKTAEQFFTMIQQPELLRVIDVRLNNVSQLAGFAKRDDLRYFLKTICQIDYVHRPELAPSQDILDEYKKHKGSWEDYERQFRKLLSERNIDQVTPKELIDGACLLCSEALSSHCHRRLVAEYFRDNWSDVEIRHL